MEIINYIPRGHKNAISRQYLSTLTKQSDRKNRDMIEKNNLSGNELIINLQDGHGYFVPDETEQSLIRIYRAQEQHRFMSLKNKLEGINRIMNMRKTKNVPEIEKNQMDIFDYIGGD